MKRRKLRGAQRMFQPPYKQARRAAIAGITLATIATGQAAIISASTGPWDGNLVLTSGADTYVADGHGVNPGPYTISVAADQTITGHSGLLPINLNRNALRVTAEGYSIVNDGALTRTGPLGLIFSGVRLDANVDTFVNNGTISGQSGISTLNGSQIGLLTNTGTITGITVDGVEIGNDTTIENSGTITGNLDGISAGDDATITNEFDGTITGSLGDGLDLGDRASVNNSGEITGGDNGIEAGNSLTLTNSASGEITGGDDGVNAGDNVSITNSGTITGGDDGIDVGDYATIVNEEGGVTQGDYGIYADNYLTLTNSGVIEGTYDGVLVDDYANITNSGTINGELGDGVDVGDDARVDNSGTITGDNYGVHASDDLYLTNSGTITGGNDGVHADDDAIIINEAGGTITGITGDGVDAWDDLYLENHGTIVGGDNGVELEDDGFIVNTGTITGGDNGIDAEDDLTLTNSGSILGGDAGVSADDDADILNSGTIAGGQDGIVVGDDAIIVNTVDGTISGGAWTGIFAGEDLELTNDGVITGGLNGVIASGGDADIVNSGTITGANFGIWSAGGSNVVTNTGTISGGIAAIQTGGGNDVINLNGGLVDGDVDGGGGFDQIYFGGASTVDGDIYNFEYGAKDGLGLTLITGNAQITNLDVDSGGIYIQGGFTGDSSVINVGGLGSSAALGGLGVWDDVTINVFDGGAISPGALPIALSDLSDPFSPTVGSIGTMEINGDLNLLAGSSYRVDISPTGPFVGGNDLLIVNGTTNISAGSQVQLAPTSNTSPLVDGQYLVIQGGATAGFESAVFNLAHLGGSSEFVSQTVALGSYEFAGDVYVSVDHDYVVAGATSNGVAIGNYLNSVYDEFVAGNPAALPFAEFLAAIDYGAGLAGIEALDPSLSVTAADTIIHSGHTLNRVIENHNAAVRAGNSGSTVYRQPVGVQYDSKGGLVQQSPGYASTASNWNVWVAGSLESLDIDRGGLADLDGDSGQVTVGVDFRVAPQLVLGIFGQWSETDLSGGGVGVDVETSYFGAYANWGANEGLFFDALLAYGDHDIDSRRFAPGIGNLGSSYDADGWSAFIGGGYMINTGAISWGPVAGLEYQNVDIDSFTEGGPLGLAVQGRDVESLRSLLGLKAEATVGLGAMPSTIYASARWAHDFKADRDRSLTASFAGLPGVGGFTTTAADRSENSLILNAGINVGVTESITVGLGYFGEVPFDGDGVEAHGGMLEAKFAF